MFEALWHYFESRDWPVHHEQVDQIAATLAEHGVYGACGLSYPHKPGVASALNDFMEAVGRRMPMFRPFGSVHIDDENLAAEVDRVIESPHLHGFKFQPLVQKFDVNDGRLDNLYQRCVEADTPLIMHLGTAPIANPFVGFNHFSKLMKRFPDLRVCVAHMGAFEVDSFLSALDDYPRMYLDTTMINVHTDLFDTTYRGDEERLRRHANRICFGSDWPNVPYPYQEALDSVSRFPFEPEQLPGVLGGNALAFLGEDL